MGCRWSRVQSSPPRPIPPLKSLRCNTAARSGAAAALAHPERGQRNEAHERRALAGLLPPETLRDERKPAFNSLLASALEGPDAITLRELVANPSPELAARLRGDAVAAGARTLDLWRIVTLELWLRRLAGSSPAGSSAPNAQEM